MTLTPTQRAALIDWPTEIATEYRLTDRTAAALVRLGVATWHKPATRNGLRLTVGGRLLRGELRRRLTT